MTPSPWWKIDAPADEVDACRYTGFGRRFLYTKSLLAACVPLVLVAVALSGPAKTGWTIG